MVKYTGRAVRSDATPILFAIEFRIVLDVTEYFGESSKVQVLLYCTRVPASIAASVALVARQYFTVNSSKPPKGTSLLFERNMSEDNLL